MKPVRIVLRVLALLLALGAWWYWPEKSASSANANLAASLSTNTTTVAPPKAVPAPSTDKLPQASLPVVANTANATALSESRQENLDGLLKFQSALEQSLNSSTDPKERDGLEHELAQLQLQIQHDLGPSTVPPVLTTHLGEITLAEGRPLQRVLASGDQATLTASSVADGSWAINVIVRHVETDGSANVESTSVAAQPGQTVVVKTNGNEIHFTPTAAGASSN